MRKTTLEYAVASIREAIELYLETLPAHEGAARDILTTTVAMNA